MEILLEEIINILFSFFFFFSKNNKIVWLKFSRLIMKLSINLNIFNKEIFHSFPCIFLMK